MQTLVTELARFLKPLDRASQSLGATKVMLGELGWNLQARADQWSDVRNILRFTSRIDDLLVPLQQLADAQTDGEAIEAAADALQVIIPMIGDLGAMNGSPPNISPFDMGDAFWSELGEDLFGFLT